MSEENIEERLNEEREKVRINSMRMLKFLGYNGDMSKMTQEQLDARIELYTEQKQNQTGDATTKTPVFFSGIDEERENIKAVENAKPTELDMQEYMEGYDALTALIPQLRPNGQVAHMTQLAEREDIRIIRVPCSIKLNEKETIIRRIVL